MQARKKLVYILNYVNTEDNQQLELQILSLFREKFSNSASFPEFMMMQKHFHRALPATTGHSNIQRPDGVIQFKCKGELCHLFIEIDADNKENQREVEAMKIWQDISSSVEGQGSSTSPLIARVNCRNILCAPYSIELCSSRNLLNLAQK